MAESEVAAMRCPNVADLAAAFVLAALEEPEMDAVRRHLAACPEPHPEFAELESVVPALLETIEVVAPPPGLKARIMEAAAAEARGAPGMAPAAPMQPAAVDAPATGRAIQDAVAERPRRFSDLFRRPVWAAVAMAATLAVVALGAWNVQLGRDLASLAAYRNGVAAVLEQAAEPGARLAVLTPPDGAAGPSGLAAVAANGAVGVVMRDLAPTVGMQVYETWLIGADGTPVAIGGFSVDASGTASFVARPRQVAGDVVVALTREPGPGATTPTAPVVVVGPAEERSQAT